MPSVTRSRADTTSRFLGLLSFSATAFSAPTVDNCVRPGKNATHTTTESTRRVCHANASGTLWARSRALPNMMASEESAQIQGFRRPSKRSGSQTDTRAGVLGVVRRQGEKKMTLNRVGTRRTLHTVEGFSFLHEEPLPKPQHSMVHTAKDDQNKRPIYLNQQAAKKEREGSAVRKQAHHAATREQVQKRRQCTCPMAYAPMVDIFHLLYKVYYGGVRSQ